MKIMMTGLVSVCLLSVASAAAEPVLSIAENAVIARSIAALKNPEDRALAAKWSDAKKVAEMICRKSASATLRRQVRSTDRVFLGTGDEAGLSLVSDRLLSGSGSLRSRAGWQDFTFECQLDPHTGRPIRFRATVKP